MILVETLKEIESSDECKGNEGLYMKPTYIPLEGNIHIRLDFFTTNIISIVNKADGITLSSDEMIVTFPPP